jgi:hypothetical protein
MSRDGKLPQETTVKKVSEGVTRKKPTIAVEKRETQGAKRVTERKWLPFETNRMLNDRIGASSRVDVEIPKICIPAMVEAGPSHTKKTSSAKAKRRFRGEILEEMEVVDTERWAAQFRSTMWALTARTLGERYEALGNELDDVIDEEWE